MTAGQGSDERRTKKASGSAWKIWFVAATVVVFAILGYIAWSGFESLENPKERPTPTWTNQPATSTPTSERLMTATLPATAQTL